jgi:hypothetical protein
MAPTPLPPADYQLEAGATRNYEPWRDKEKVVAQAVASLEDEEKGNAMKASCWCLLGPVGHTLLPACWAPPGCACMRGCAGLWHR